MSRMLYRLGRLTARHPWRTIGVWAILAVTVVAASGAIGHDLEDSVEVPGLDSQQAVDLLSDAGSADAGLTAQVVVSPLDPSATFFASEAARAELSSLQAELAALPEVIGASAPTTALAHGPDAAVASGTVSADGTVALVRLQYPVMEELGADDLAQLQEVLAEARQSSTALRVEAGGDLFFAFEEPETGAGEMLGLVAAVIILFVAFGSAVAMGLPIGMALFGVALGTSSLALLAHLVDVPSWAPILASMVGLGVGIDYALFLVTRHRENMASGMDVVEAAGRAVATAGQAVVFAGGTVVVAILGLAVAGIPFVTAAGVAIALVVLVMVAASVTLLPAFLGLAGPWINRLGLPRSGRSRARRARHRAGWERWANHVGRHAVAYAVGVTLVLLALTAPVLALRLGYPDEGTLHESRTERQAYDMVAEGFGAGANGPLVIAVDLDGDDAVVEPLRAAIAGDPGIVSVAPAVVDEQGDVASIVAVPTTAPQDDATYETIQRLRSDVFPAVLGDGAVSAHIGGQTASFSDISERVEDRLPLFIGSVVLLSFLLLVLVFRSILVPLKAAVLNLLSIGAAYGVLVMVFQWGWGASLIGLETTVPIVSFIPMFMFAIVFGLSMDYEVFLLSRVREHYLATGDNDASVVRGLASTARVITSAALIMVSVFLGFVLGEDPTTKMMGLGLATAILVDATIVRTVLVPASMKLLGDANWWLPGWLDRRLPAIDIEGAPAPSDDPVTPADTTPAPASAVVEEHDPPGDREPVGAVR